MTVFRQRASGHRTPCRRKPPVGSASNFARNSGSALTGSCRPPHCAREKSRVRAGRGRSGSGPWCPRARRERARSDRPRRGRARAGATRPSCRGRGDGGLRPARVGRNVASPKTAPKTRVSPGPKIAPSRAAKGEVAENDEERPPPEFRTRGPSRDDRVFPERCADRLGEGHGPCSFFAPADPRFRGRRRFARECWLRWRTQIRTARRAREMRRSPKAREEARATGASAEAARAAAERHAGRPCGGEPCARGEKTERPGEPEEHAKRTSPPPCRRPRPPETAARPGRGGRERAARPASSAPPSAKKRPAGQHRKEALQGVQQKCQPPGGLRAGAQHVRRADVARVRCRGGRRDPSRARRGGRTARSREDSSPARGPRGR